MAAFSDVTFPLVEYLRSNTLPFNNSLIRTIITVDQSASEESRRVAPRGWLLEFVIRMCEKQSFIPGRRSRPIISDPQPIVSNSVPEVNR